MANMSQQQKHALETPRQLFTYDITSRLLGANFYLLWANYLQAVNATADMTEINAKMSDRLQHNWLTDQHRIW